MFHYNILNGNGKDKFFPDNFTKLYELVVMMVNSHDSYLCQPLINGGSATVSPYADVPVGYATAQHFARAKQLGYLDGLVTEKDGQDYINPNRFVTVSDVRKIAQNILKTDPVVINTRDFNRLGSLGSTLRRGETADMIMNLFFSERGLNQ